MGDVDRAGFAVMLPFGHRDGSSRTVDQTGRARCTVNPHRQTPGTVDHSTQTDTQHRQTRSDSLCSDDRLCWVYHPS